MIRTAISARLQAIMLLNNNDDGDDDDVDDVVTSAATAASGVGMTAAGISSFVALDRSGKHRVVVDLLQ